MIYLIIIYENIQAKITILILHKKFINEIIKLRRKILS